MTPPMSLTSRGLSISVLLLSHVVGGRNLCIAIVGQDVFGTAFAIPVRQVSEGKVFTRLCVEGDPGGFILIDGNEIISTIKLIFIYIRQSYNELSLPRSFRESVLRVRTRNMDSYMVWMEPLPIYNNTMQHQLTTATFLGGESIFPSDDKVSPEFILPTYRGIEYLLPCMTTDGVIFGIILKPDDYNIIPHKELGFPDEKDTTGTFEDLFCQAIDQIVEYYKGAYGTVRELPEYCGLTVKYMESDSNTSREHSGTGELTVIITVE
ncbi:hypothetical protein F4859DRAFT_2272 [Xylaria cf. heliscus]|nr:hypothetical protein F4859DRAFT_2272 [Xylaria cf. heliscus]